MNQPLPPLPRRTLALLAGLTVALALVRWLPAIHYSMYHNDEAYLVRIALGFIGGDLNPRWFNYHTLSMYVLGAVYFVQYQFMHLAGMVANKAEFTGMLFSRHDLLYPVARLVYTLAHTAGCMVLAVVLWRHFGTRIGAVGFTLVAAWLPYGVTASDYARVDSFVFLFTAVLVYAACFAPKGRRSFFLAVIAAAAAFASKVPAIVLLPVLLAVLAGDVYRRHYPARYLGYAVLIYPVAVFVFMPYMVLDFASYQLAIDNVTTRASGAFRHPGKIYHDTPVGKLLAIPAQLIRETGLPTLALTALFGWQRRRLLTAMLFPLAYAMAFSTSLTLDGYWLIPVYPFLIFFAVAALADLSHSETVRATLSRLPGGAGPAALLVALYLAWMGAFHHDGIMRWARLLTTTGTDNRIAATRWMEHNLPPNAIIVLAGFGHTLPRLFSDDPEITLKQYFTWGIRDKQVLSDGFDHYYRENRPHRRAFRLGKVDYKNLDDPVDPAYMPPGTYLVLAENPLNTGAFYDYARTQKHVKTFDRRGPTISIYQTRGHGPQQ